MEIGAGRLRDEWLDESAVYLVAEGLAHREGQGVIFSRQVIETLRRRELNVVAANIASKTGLEYYPAAAGDPISGTYRQRLNLAFHVPARGWSIKLVVEGAPRRAVKAVTGLPASITRKI